MTTGKYNSEEYIGNKYGKLTVIGIVHHTNNNGSKQWYWNVICECGTKKEVVPNRLITRKIVSCGCYARSGKQAPRIHDESHTRLHNIWCGMNNRCCEWHKHNNRYGNRGIKVCEEWSDYTKFAEWARSHGYADGLSIERVDVNGDYCPENCTWIPLGKQARNRTTTYWVEYQGERMSLAEAAEKAGLPYKQVWYRINRSGWSVEKALSTPLKRPPELLEKCKERGLDYRRVYSRVHTYGWSEEDALNIPNMGKGANQTTYNRSNK